MISGVPSAAASSSVNHSQVTSEAIRITWRRTTVN
jgi:hypothetical protein